MSFRPLIRSALAALIGSSAVLASGCDRSPACQAKATLGGKTGTGSGADEASAKRLAWRDYCVRHDPTVDGKHRVWKAAGGKSTGKKAQDIANVSALKRILEQCEKRSSENPGARVEATCSD